MLPLTNVWIIKTSLEKRDEGINMVCKSKRILRGGRRISTASNAPTTVRNSLGVPPPLQAVLEEVAASIPRAVG